MSARGFMVESLHDPEMVTKDGLAYVMCEGQRTGSARMGYSTPTRRRRRKMERRGARLRRMRWEKVNRAQLARNLRIINRETQPREIEELLEQMAAAGEIVKNPDGTFQALPPTLADRMHARRRDARS